MPTRPLGPLAWLLRTVSSRDAASAPRLIRSAGLILRDATRALRAAPAHSLFIVLVLAVGVTTGTVTFSVVDAVVLKPLTLAQPEQLVSIPTRDAEFKERITPEVFWRLHDHLSSRRGAGPADDVDRQHRARGGADGRMACHLHQR